MKGGDISSFLISLILYILLKKYYMEFLKNVKYDSNKKLLIHGIVINDAFILISYDMKGNTSAIEILEL